MEGEGSIKPSPGRVSSGYEWFQYEKTEIEGFAFLRWFAATAGWV